VASRNDALTLHDGLDSNLRNGVATVVEQKDKLFPAVLACYHEAALLATKHIPYAYGGGHNASIIRSPPLIRPGPPGYDCSSWTSRILEAGKLLGGRVLDTHELELWGKPGPGKWMTMWVDDSDGVDHCFLEFHSSWRFQHRWSQAAHTGTICGWLTADTTGFHPRHAVGT
jgi:hypothetical protein